jgi:hypothetical protein
MEEAEAAEVSPCIHESSGTVEDRVDLLGTWRGIRRDAVPCPPTTVGHGRNSALSDLAIRPACDDIGPNREEQMDVIAHDRERNHIDRNPVRNELEAADQPRSPRWIVEERFPTHAPRDAVIDAGIPRVDDVASSLCHAANLRPDNSEPPNPAFVPSRLR